MSKVDDDNAEHPEGCRCVMCLDDGLWPFADVKVGSSLRIKMPGPVAQAPGPLVFSQVEWQALLAETMGKITELGRVKGGEYSGDTDRLSNFRRNAQDCGLSMEQVWRVYAGKHWDSITQYVKDQALGTSRPRAEPLSGRADDLIVYLLLFKAMLKEKGEA